MIDIYVHKNIINGKCYVGQSKNIEKRWSENGNRYRECPKLYAAIKKYGFNNFISEVIDIAYSKEEADLKEEKYVKLYDSYVNGYNATPTGYQSKDALKNYVKQHGVSKPKIKVKRPDNAARNKARAKPNVEVIKKEKKGNIEVHVYNLITQTDEYFRSIDSAISSIGASDTYVRKAFRNGWTIYKKYKIDLVNEV